MGSLSPARDDKNKIESGDKSPHSKFAVALLTLIAGCRTQPVEPSEGGPLAIVVSGDTAGWIVPCGCTSNQSGGLPRRATCLSQVAEQSDLLVADVGGAAGGKSEYDRLKFEAILQGERLPWASGGPQHRARRKRPSARLTSAKSPGGCTAPSFPRTSSRRTGSRWPIRYGSSPRPAATWRSSACSARKFAAPGLRVDPPREAILQALRKAAGRYQAAIVLAYLPEEELQALAEGLPEVDVLVGGPTGQPVAPRHVGPTLVLSATKQGKFLARLDAPPDSKQHWAGSIVELSERFADNEAQVANVAAVPQRAWPPRHGCERYVVRPSAAGQWRR